jgi:hypothetical protein
MAPLALACSAYGVHWHRSNTPCGHLLRLIGHVGAEGVFMRPAAAARLALYVDTVGQPRERTTVQTPVVS